MYRFLTLLGVMALVLSACTTPPERDVTPAGDTLASAADSLIAQNDYLAAAQLYLSEAQTAPENQRDALRLRGAELLARGPYRAQLEQVFGSIDATRLNAELLARYNLLAAQLALLDNRPEQALGLLGSISSPELLPDLGKQYFQLRADAYAQTGNALESARALIWLDGLLDEPGEKIENQYRLWERLSSLSSESLQALNTVPPPDVLSGWMELILITRTWRGDRDRWSSELSHWRARYPRHPAENALLPDLLHQVGQFAAQANRIAVLLPLSGRAQASAAAVRDGILAAFYHSEPPKPQLRFYDTAGDALRSWSLYQQAISEGADFVIGPLLKPSIEQLAAGAQLSVPVLALNTIGTAPAEVEVDTVRPPLYQFGLAPEDEAHQVAEHAFADGHQKMIALAPDSAWGRRVLAAFAERLEGLGGMLLDVEYYPPDAADFTQPIRRTLNLNASEQRHQAMQRQLGRKLVFEPRRRQDVEAVFVLAFPQQARQIKPQLRFHRAGDLPVYSTSHIHQGGEAGPPGSDMDGYIFCDIPWVLDTRGNWAEQRSALEAIWPQRTQRYQRLFALGFDAYQLVPWLDTLHLPGFSNFPGATGVLTLDADKRVHRTLEWARYKGGTPQKLMSMEGLDEREPEPENDWR